MAALTSQSIPANALTTPTSITPAASDTIAEAQFGANGCILRVITTGTASNISITDPGVTPMSNAGTSASLAAPSTGSRMLVIPRSAISNTSQVATVTSSSQTGLTYELYRI